jgi:hypothetical protein
MTAQATEILLFEGEELSLCNEPLGPFIENNKMDFQFSAPHTALWRGYIGTWAIEHDRLYLKSLEGTILSEKSGLEDVGLERIFPGFPDGVFAHWFSGELRCAQGALLKYVHGGFGSVYERDLFFKVKKGLVLDRRVVVNGKAEEGAPEGYHISALTTIPRS